MRWLATLILASILFASACPVAFAEKDDPHGPTDTVTTTNDNGLVTVQITITEPSTPQPPPPNTNTPTTQTPTQTHPSHTTTGHALGTLFPSNPDHTTPLPPIIRTALAHLQLPEPTPLVGPDPDLNPWKIAATGYPLWFWTPEPPTRTTTITHDNLTLTLTAHRTHTTFYPGDGTTIHCTTTTAWTPTTPAQQPSPDCGHRYHTKGPHTLTATTTWTITWTSAHTTGQLTLTRTASRTLNIGELTTIVTG